MGTSSIFLPQKTFFCLMLHIHFFLVSDDEDDDFSVLPPVPHAHQLSDVVLRVACSLRVRVWLLCPGPAAPPPSSSPSPTPGSGLLPRVWEQAAGYRAPRARCLQQPVRRQSELRELRHLRHRGLSVLLSGEEEKNILMFFLWSCYQFC